MKTLKDYLPEAETYIDNPTTGDVFFIELAPDHIIESYVVDIEEDGPVLYGDQKTIELLEQYGISTEDIARYGAVGSSPAMGHTMGEQEDEPVHADSKATNETAVDRILELAGLPRPMIEDQDAAIVAQKELDADAAQALGEQDKENMDCYEDEVGEAKYQGREVPLNKPMAGDVKKSKVYVKKPNGNVVKVNFGDPNMRIKKSNPDRRRSFRARHNCDNPGPKWKARYWSCRAW